MRIFKAILFLLLLANMQVSAQSKKESAVRPSSNVPLNRNDSAGKKHGTWMTTQSARMGDDAFTEFGSYEHGDKTGPWYKLDNEGDLVSMETYRNGVLDGEAKYFEKGHLICVGYYRGLNPSRPFDTIMVEHPETGAQILRVVPTERGTVRQGTWRFYDADYGRLTREEDYQLDELIAKKDFPMTKDDSVYYEKRNARLPHSKKATYQPPASKRVSYTN